MCSIVFVDTLQKAGAKADLILYDGKTHTDLFLQVSDFSDVRILQLSLLQTYGLHCYSHFMNLQYLQFRLFESNLK